MQVIELLGANKMAKRKIILVSTSPRRNGLLQQIGLEFEVIPSKYKEDMSLKLKPKEMVMAFAQGKAIDVAKDLKEGVVIGVDTFVVFKGEKLGKPKSKENATKILKIISGKNINVFSGICIIDIDNGKKILEHEVTKVKLKKLTDEEINNYVNTGEPLDKAGAFGIQERGAIFIEKIDGCYSNVVGLPLHCLYNNLKEIGINIFEY